MSPRLKDRAIGLTGRDWYKFAVSVLMTLIGGIMVFRTLSAGIFLLPLLMGGGFIVLGLYRLSFYYRHFRKKTT